jgi:hypothetical protein
MPKFYEVHVGDGDGTYPAGATYDDVDELLGDLPAALAAGRSLLINPVRLTAEEYDAIGDEFAPDLNPLTGQRRP